MVCDEHSFRESSNGLTKEEKQALEYIMQRHSKVLDLLGEN